jgi:alkylated DNA repair dioxygenase AlkB
MPGTLRDSGDVRIIDAFLPESKALCERLVADIDWDSRIRARKSASFGVPYNYSGIDWPAAPFPDSLLPLLDRVAPVVGFTPNNCLLNYYPTGVSTMGFHFDATDELEPGTGIAVASLGTERTITFRRIADKTVTERYPLVSGSLLWMSAPMQAEWMHAILGDNKVREGRVSLTFRRMNT